MKTVLTKGLDDSIKDEVAQGFASSTIIRRRLVEVLSDKSSSEDKKSVLENAYDNPNWAYKQADSRGYRRAIAEIISLLT